MQLNPSQQKKKNIAVASSLNTQAPAQANPLPPQSSLLTVRRTSDLQNKKKDIKLQQNRHPQVAGTLSRGLGTLRSLRKFATVRACRQWARLRRGRLTCIRSRLRVYCKKGRVSTAFRTKWVLRTSRLYPGRRRALRRARTAVLLHYRRRQALFPRAVWRSLRRKYSSRTRRVLHRAVRTYPTPLARRLLASRSQAIQTYLRRRRRRFARFKRAVSQAAPERRVRSYLHRLVRRLTVAMVRGLRVSASKQLCIYRSRDLRGIAYALRKNRGSLQYSRLYNRYIMTMLGRTRLAAIRYLRFQRQFIPRKGRAYPRARKVRGRSGRCSPCRPRRRRWFLRRTYLAPCPPRHQRHGRRKQLSQLSRRTKLRYPRAARRILRLQKINRHIKRSFSFQRSPISARPHLRFIRRRRRYEQIYVGAAEQRLLRRTANTPLSSVAVHRRLRLRRNQVQLRTFVRRIGKLSRKQKFPHWQVKRQILNFFSVSRGLHCRRYFLPSALNDPTSVYAINWRRRNFSRRSRPVWHFSRHRLRARRLGFLRIGGVASFFVNNSMYYYPQLQNYEKISSAGSVLLQTQAAAAYLHQLATMHGARRTLTARRVCVGSSLIPLPPAKFARTRGRLRLYAKVRFILRGLQRRPRFNRVRRIARIYQRRRSRAKRKLARAVRRMSGYRQSAYCLKRRTASAQVLKTARAGHLACVRSGRVLRYWKRFRRVLLRGRIRTRRLRRRLRALYRRSRRRRKPFRRWRNKRYKGRWWNFRRPAWLNKQYAPRRLKLRKSFVLLPAQRALTARLAWLLRHPSRSVLFSGKPISPIVPVDVAAASKSSTAQPTPKLPFASVPAAVAEAAATRNLWAKIFATKGNQPPASLPTSASPHTSKLPQHPSIFVQNKKKQ